MTMFAQDDGLTTCSRLPPQMQLSPLDDTYSCNLRYCFPMAVELGEQDDWIKAEVAGGERYEFLMANHFFGGLQVSPPTH